MKNNVRTSAWLKDNNGASNLWLCTHAFFPLTIDLKLKKPALNFQPFGLILKPKL
jgi:hypothetical protein